LDTAVCYSDLFQASVDDVKDIQEHLLFLNSPRRLTKECIITIKAAIYRKSGTFRYKAKVATLPLPDLLKFLLTNID
jgi:hypothetical protein